MQKQIHRMEAYKIAKKGKNRLEDMAKCNKNLF